MRLSGHLDLCGPELIEGWLLIDSGGQSKPLLEIYVGDILLGGCVADIYRPDLDAAGLADGRCGFSFTLKDDNARLDFKSTRVRIIDAPVFLLPDSSTIITQREPSRQEPLGFLQT